MLTTMPIKQIRSITPSPAASLSQKPYYSPSMKYGYISGFRNPSELGVAAAELIEKAGLKGFREDGAMISNIHTPTFFINAGGSTSQDMLDHIALAKEKVDQKFGVQLREEIIHVQPYSDGLIPNRNKYQPCNL